MSTIGDRIREFAKSKYGTVAKLAEALEMKPPSLHPYLVGKSTPGHRLQEKLRKVGCDIEWLMTGADSRKQTAAERYNNLLTKDMMDGEARVAVAREMIPGKGSIKFFHGSIGASANNPWLDVQEEKIVYEDAFKTTGNHYMIKVRGSSMLDAGIKEDDIIVIDTGLVPENRDIVAVSIDGAIVLKRMIIKDGRRLLVSENKMVSYPELELNGDESVQLAGVAVQIQTPLLRRGGHPLD